MSKGAFRIWPIDSKAALVGDPFPPGGQDPDPPDPSNENAVDIYFGVSSATNQPIPKEQADLQVEIGKVLRSVNLLYRGSDRATSDRNKVQFRNYYVRLFRLAQVGLEGQNAAPEIAKNELDSVKADLIDDESGRVKNGHLVRLARAGAMLSTPFAIGYVIFRLIEPNSRPATFLAALNIERDVFSNFMILWLGCFLGVWLSYGVRTTNFTLSDLTVTDSDRLVPTVRMLFAGSLTMLLGIVFNLGLVQVKLGTYSLNDFSTQPMLAFLLGTFCGISELLLPTTVAKRASDMISSIK